MRLVLLASGSMIGEVVCGEEALFIGSREGCAVHFPDGRISPQQAVIFQDRQSWILQPLSVREELLLNGIQVHDKVELRVGDEIKIFDYGIRTYPSSPQQQQQSDEPGARTTSTRQVSVESLTKFVQFVLPPGTIIKKLEEPLTIDQADLKRLAAVNTRLAACELVEELMTVALRTLLEIFAAHRAWIGVRRLNYGSMDYIEGRLVSGQLAELPETGERLKPRVLDRGQNVMFPRVSVEDRSSVLAGPLPGPEGPLGMVYLDTGDLGRVFEPKDLDLFVLSLNVLAVQLDAVLRAIAKNRAAAIEGQVSVAHAIQARLTPRKLPQFETLQFGAFREPGREGTGDIYDIVRLANKMAAIMVACTRATGPMPSMLMSAAQATFRTSAMHLHSPHIMMRSLNFLLYDGQDDHPLDAFVAVIDPNTGEMRYAVAGSPGAFVVGARGEERKLLPEPALPSLGLDRNVQHPLMQEQLQPGETLALFTPGVTTAKNRQGDTFGAERFANILCDGFGQQASSMLKEMLSDLQQFTEGGSQPDDITVLLAHRVAE